MKYFIFKKYASVPKTSPCEYKVCVTVLIICHCKVQFIIFFKLLAAPMYESVYLIMLQFCSQGSSYDIFCYDR